MDRAPEERVTWLERLVGHVRPGRIVEFGCGSGFVLEFLSQRFTESSMVGVDRSLQRLAGVVQRRLPNATPVRADIGRCGFHNAVFDTALFVGSLHEVFSSGGTQEVERALTMARDVIVPDGVLLIQDFLRPPPGPVEMGFKNEAARQRFTRFVREFRPREIRYRTAEVGVRLDIADAVEFVSKYRSPTEQDWQEEMGETHFALTEKDFRTLSERAGFAVSESAFLSKRSGWWADVTKDLDLSFAPDYGWIHLALTKERA